MKAFVVIGGYVEPGRMEAQEWELYSLRVFEDELDAKSYYDELKREGGRFREVALRGVEVKRRT